eukprot:CCRYP_010132-RA/>CCRYP_010132-RA protein AED:0.26 eAED:0.31 QI:0/0/0.5/1/0/0/2/2591/75
MSCGVCCIILSQMSWIIPRGTLFLVLRKITALTETVPHWHPEVTDSPYACREEVSPRIEPVVSEGPIQEGNEQLI